MFQQATIADFWIARRSLSRVNSVSKTYRARLLTRGIVKGALRGAVMLSDLRESGSRTKEIFGTSGIKRELPLVIEAMAFKIFGTNAINEPAFAKCAS